jgi:hypothetical protein
MTRWRNECQSAQVGWAEAVGFAKWCSRELTAAETRRSWGVPCRRPRGSIAFEEGNGDVTRWRNAQLRRAWWYLVDGCRRRASIHPGRQPRYGGCLLGDRIRGGARLRRPDAPSPQ